MSWLQEPIARVAVTTLPALLCASPATIRFDTFHSGLHAKFIRKLKRTMRQLKKIGVIGAGTMGNGIAHVFARSGFSVTLIDVEQRFVDRGLATIQKNLEREVAKGKLSAEDS